MELSLQPGTKISMGSTIHLVLGDGVGNRQFIVPSLIGMTYCAAKALLRQMDWFGAIVAMGINDTWNAFIYRQRPKRFDDEKKFQYIRSGQIDGYLVADGETGSRYSR